MNSKTVLATVAAIVLFFFGGWVIYGMLLESYYASHSIEYEGLMRETPMLWGFIVSNIAAGIMLVYILNGMGVRSAGRGFMVAFIIGALLAISIDFSMYAMYNLFDGIGVVLVDALVNGVFGGIIGAVTGWILGMGSHATAEPVTE